MNTVTNAHNLPYQEALDLILDFVGKANNGESREAIVTRLVTALVTPPQADTHIPATVRVPASMGKSEAILSDPVYLAAAPVTLTYTNYRGETSVRRITPLGLRFGSTEWHPEPQWLMTAYDHDKDATRDFAFKDFGKPVDVAAVRKEALEEVLQAIKSIPTPMYVETINGHEDAYRAVEALTSAEPSQHPDDTAVDNLARLMKAKLAQKRKEGRGGWQEMPAEELSAMLRECVAKGDPIDVANFCMMLSANGAGIAPAPDVPELDASLA